MREIHKIYTSHWITFCE